MMTQNIPLILHSDKLYMYLIQTKLVYTIQVKLNIRGLSQKSVDTRCFHLIFNIYKYCCISTERLINADFIDTKIVNIVSKDVE